MDFAPIFETEARPGITVITPLRDINSFEKTDLDQAADKVLDRLPNEEVVHVVIDFRKVPYFGTMMLTALLRFWKRVRDARGSMVLCNLSEDELDVLRVTRLDTVWRIYPTLEDAINASVLAEARG